jgi:hypothetical protein
VSTLILFVTLNLLYRALFQESVNAGPQTELYPVRCNLTQKEYGTERSYYNQMQAWQVDTCLSAEQRATRWEG